MQAHDRIVRLFDERIEKDEIEFTYETLREQITKDKFEDICSPEFVATAKSQIIELSERMPETLYLNFKAYGRKNIPRSRVVSNEPQLSETK